MKANDAPKPFTELERGVHAALETYANVHRGSGHNSLVSTYLYEQAREIVLEHLELGKDKYAVIFCTPRGAELLAAQLRPGSYLSLSSRDIGLALGVRALAVDRKALPKGAPLQTGGGTARLVSPGWVIWAKAPDRFEAGTPAIVNVIAFALALRLLRQYGNDAFRGAIAATSAVAEEPAGAEQPDVAEILHHDDLEKYAGRELLLELRQTLIGRGVNVPTAEGTRPFINLDNAASTPTFAPIWDAVCRTWRRPGAVQQEIIREVRSICADVLAAPLADHNMIFTSNTTEAINLVAASLRNEAEPGSASVILNTLLEHNSNELPWRTIPGVSLIRLPVDAEGFLDLSELEALLRAHNQQGRPGTNGTGSSAGTSQSAPIIVAVSGASNVLGTCNDLAEISRIVHRYGARLLVDAAQLVAHRKVEWQDGGLTISPFQPISCMLRSAPGRC